MGQREQAFRRRDSVGKTFLRTFLPSLVLLLITFPSASQAVVTTAITSSGLGTTLNGGVSCTSNCIITGGTRPGGGPNLFHSFGLFSVGAGDTANFFNETGLLTSNILSRVTGNQVSNIYGTIQTTDFGSANLFLINPAGVVFGPSATLNVGGPFHVSTADYIRLTDGAQFNAIPGPQDALLTTAPPVSFGFLGSSPGSITIQGSQLSVPSSQGISLVGGNIAIQAGTLEDGTVQPARLSAPNGQINLASAASPGEFLLSNLQPSPNVDGASFTSFGTITLAAGSTVNVSGTSTVSIQGGQVVLTVNDSVLTTAASPGAQDTVTLSLGSSIVTSTSGTDPGGNVLITAGTLSLDGFGTVISTQTLGDGIGGDIVGNVGTLSLTNGAMISSTNFSFGSGQGGNVIIQGQGPGTVADSVTLSSGASISSTTVGPGPGGNLQIAAKAIQLDGVGTTLTTETDGDGTAGTITLNAGALSLTDSAAILSNNNTNFTFGFGQGGNVTIQGLQGTDSASDSVTLSNGATITTQTYGFERGGDVAITTGSLRLDGSTIRTQTLFGPGRGGDVRVTAGTLEIANASGIITETSLGDGVGGDLFLNVGTLTLMGDPVNPSKILSTNFNFGTGQGGNVTIQGTAGEGNAADSVTLSGGSRVQSETLMSGGGGQVSIAAKSLTMDGAATINSSTQGTSQGGDVLLKVQGLSLSGGATITSQTISADENAAAGGTITVQGLGEPGSKADSVIFSGQNSGIISDTLGGARPGDVAVHARTLSLTSGAVIIAGNSIGAKAGNVTVEADSAMISGGSLIQSQAFATDAGQVTITANALTLDNGSIITNTSSAGHGGDVVLNVGNLSLSSGAQINSSTFSTGRAGDITMNVGTLTLTGNAEISSSSTGSATGAAGSVTIQGLASPANSVTLTDSSLLTSAANTGHGGSITVDATTLTLNNATISASVKDFGSAPDGASVGLGNIALTASTMNVSGGIITAATSGTRNAGKMTIAAGQDLNLTNGASVTASSTGAGSAGNIELEAGNTLLLRDSTVSSDAKATQALGGDVKLTASNLIHLVDGKIVTSVQGGTTTVGGNISIDPQFVVVQGSQILTTAIFGSGGNIKISGNVVLIDPTSVLDVSSLSGLSGTIDIQAPVQNLSGTLVPLQQSYLETAGLLAQRCAARYADGQFSTFVLSARDGLPPGPGGLLPISTYVRAPGAGPKAAAMALSSQSGGESLEVSVLNKDCYR